MKPKLIVITGGPGTGKTSVINNLESLGYLCFEEVSRQVTLNARRNGVEQLFLQNPLKFSELLFEARIQQFYEAKTAQAGPVFLDRGLPDVLAYMHYIGRSYSSKFVDACKTCRYDMVFLLPPWEAIFESDSERYENFEQASQIHKFLKSTYKEYGYKFVEVPTGSVNYRANFILDFINMPNASY